MVFAAHVDYLSGGATSLTLMSLDGKIAQALHDSVEPD